MNAEAWGKYHCEVIHELAKEYNCRLNANGDGSVSVLFETTDPLGIHGTYLVELTFTAEEIDSLHRHSLIGAARGPAKPLDRRI